MQIKRQVYIAVSEAILLLAAINGSVAYGQAGNMQNNLAQTTATNKALPPGCSNYQFTTINLLDNVQLLSGPTDNDALTGYYLDETGFAHGFLWSKGVLSELDAPGSADTLPSGINNAGVVIGNYDDTVTTHGFLYHTANQSWTQLPEIPGKAYQLRK